MFIDRIVQFFLPKEDKFFVYLESMAKNMAESADIMAGLREAAGPAEFKQIAEALRLKEHETDELAHLIYEALDKTFVTPLDREDLHALAADLDNVLDIMDAAAEQIMLYKVKKLSEPMKELIRISREAALEVSKCVPLLRDISKIDEIQVHIIRVNSLENEGDKVYRKALEQLFDGTPDPLDVIRSKEVLDALEASIDASEDIMDLIRSVVVKNA